MILRKDSSEMIHNLQNAKKKILFGGLCELQTILKFKKLKTKQLHNLTANTDTNYVIKLAK